MSVLHNHALSTNVPHSPISQKDLNQLLSASHSQGPFSSVLASNGYASTLSNLSLQLPTGSDYDFSGCSFNNVTFTGDFNQSNFESVQFTQSYFHQADFSSSVFSQASFNHCAFEDTTLHGSSFINVSLNDSILTKCDLSDASFYQSSVSNTILSQANLFNVLDHENILDNSHLITNQSYDIDYAFNNATFHTIIPNIIVNEDPEWADDAESVLKARGADITYIENPAISQTCAIESIAKTLDLSELIKETLTELKNIEEHGLTAKSIVQQVLQSSAENIQTLKDYAYNLVSKSDAVFIPGGEDIVSLFYGEKTDGFQYQFGFDIDQQEIQEQLSEMGLSYDNLIEGVYFRQLLEFSMTEAAIEMQKPLMGVCHGLQSINVYMGGTLHNVEGHDGIHPILDIHAKHGLLGPVMESPMFGPSYHHQAIDVLGDGLEVVASYNNVTKAAQPTDDKQILMFQFHPEHEIDNASKNIMDYFVELSTDSAAKSKVIDIANVLDLSNNFIEGLASTQPGFDLTQPVVVETNIQPASDFSCMAIGYEAFFNFTQPEICQAIEIM